MKAEQQDQGSEIHGTQASASTGNGHANEHDDYLNDTAHRNGIKTEHKQRYDDQSSDDTLGHHDHRGYGQHEDARTDVKREDSEEHRGIQQESGGSTAIKEDGYVFQTAFLTLFAYLCRYFHAPLITTLEDQHKALLQKSLAAMPERHNMEEPIRVPALVHILLKVVVRGGKQTMPREEDLRTLEGRLCIMLEEYCGPESQSQSQICHLNSCYMSLATYLALIPSYSSHRSFNGCKCSNPHSPKPEVSRS